MEYIITKINKNLIGEYESDYGNKIIFKNAVDCYRYVCDNRIVVFRQAKNTDNRLISEYILGGYAPYLMRARMFDKMYKELMEL